MSARLQLQDGAFLLLQNGDKLLLQDDGGVTPPTGANIYLERDAVRIITLVSDDNGVTWRPRGVTP